MIVCFKKKISFYDLLKLIKRNRNPYKIKLTLKQKTTTYIFDIESNCYVLENRYNRDYIFSDYLSETLTDRQMLYNNIEIEDNYLSSKLLK